MALSVAAKSEFAIHRLIATLFRVGIFCLVCGLSHIGPT